MDILRNNSGDVKLCYEGYLYSKMSANGVAIKWECCGRKAFDCNGKLRTTMEVENPQLTCEHSHPADTRAVEAADFLAKLKKQASLVAGASAQEESVVRSSGFILYARKREDGPAPGERQLCYNGDDGSEDGHRADILTEETSSDDGDVRGEAFTAAVILKSVRVDICRDEVTEYFNRKYMAIKNLIEYYCPKRIKGKKCIEYEPKPRKKIWNRRLVYQKPVRQEPVYLSPSEAKACLYRKRGAEMAPFKIGSLLKNVEKSKKNVLWAKETGIRKTSGAMDSGHVTKTLPKFHGRLICKRTSPSENMVKELEHAPGKNDRKRRKLVTPEENLGTGEQAEEIDDADGRDKAELVDEEQVYIDEDCTEECQEDDDDFIEQKEDENLFVTFQPGEGERFVVNKEVLQQNVVREVDQIVVKKEIPEQNVVKEEVDQIVVKMEVPEHNVVEEIDQIEVKKPNEEHFVERVKDEKHFLEQDGEQFVGQKKDKGQFEDEQQDVVGEESENIVGKHEEEESNVVKEIAEQSVVHREEDWVVVLQEEEQSTKERGDEDKCVLQGEDKEQLLVKGEREQIVIDDERIV